MHLASLCRHVANGHPSALQTVRGVHQDQRLAELDWLHTQFSHQIDKFLRKLPDKYVPTVFRLQANQSRIV